MILVLALISSLAACGGSDNKASVYWLNFKPEIDETLRTLAEQYTEQTGVGVKIVTAVFENMIANCIDNFGWSRKKATVINCVLVLALSTPCVLGYNLLSGVNLLGMNILGIEDFLVSNLLLPVGALIILLFCTFRFGWGFDNFLAEANTGKGIKLKRGLRFYLKYILPSCWHLS